MPDDAVQTLQKAIDDLLKRGVKPLSIVEAMIHVNERLFVAMRGR